MSLKASGRSSNCADTMRLEQSDSVPAGRVHGIRLADPGSCSVQKGRTLTLEEWKAQQSRPTAA